MSFPSQRTRARVLGVLLGLAVGAPPALIATAPVTVRGRAFGFLVERALPPVGGRVRVGGGRWSWETVLALARERPAPLVLEDVHVSDPEGREVLHVVRLAARLEVHRRTRTVIVHDLIADGVSSRFEAARSGGGAGLVNAFAPARGRGGAEVPSPGFSLSIPNAIAFRSSASFDFADWGLTLTDMPALTASFSYRVADGRGPTVSFEVRGVEARAGGLLRVTAAGRPWLLPFARARIDRIATLEGVPDALRVDARDIETGRSRLSLAATFRGVLGDDAAPGASLKVDATLAADAVHAVLRSGRLADTFIVGGVGADLSIAFDGPYASPTLDVRARGFDLGYRKLHLSDVAGHVVGEPRATRLRLEGLSADWRGMGRLRGAVSLDTTSDALAVRRVSLTLTRPARMPAPSTLRLRGRSEPEAPPAGATVDVADVRLVGGALIVPKIAVPVAGGRLKASGRITLRDAATGRWLSAPVLDMTLAARGLRLDRAVGTGFLGGVLTGRARLRGPLWDLTFHVTFPENQTVTVFGEKLRLPARTTSVLTRGAAHVSLKLLGARTTALSASGYVDLLGRLALDLAVKDFPLGRLPAVADSGLGLEGELFGRLRLSGTLASPAVAGRLWIFPVGLRGQEFGGGEVTISTDSTGAFHTRGRLMEGVNVDGTLATGAGGPSGALTLRLDRVRLDPLIPPLSADHVVHGVGSGVLVARLGSQGAALDGTLSDLTLTIARAPARARGGTGPPVTLSAQGPTAVAARPGGVLTLGPAHLAGPTGPLDVMVRSLGAEVTGTLRGRAELTALAPLLPPQIAHPAGALFVDLSASRAVAGGPLAVHGELTIERPVSFSWPGLSATARVAAGRVRLARGALLAEALPVTFAAALPSGGPISHASGTVRVDARITAAPASSTLRVVADDVRLWVPLVGRAPIAVRGGTARFEGAPLALDEVVVRELDLPLRGETERLKTPAATIDRASFDLRLRGVPRRTLTLSGRVDILAAHLHPEAASAAAPMGGEPEGQVSPTLRNPALDLQVRARHGAVTAELGPLPDVHLDADVRARGTLTRPVVSGDARARGAYSAVVMALQRLFR
jgi:hypothetical protein